MLPLTRSVDFLSLFNCFVCFSVTLSSINLWLLFFCPFFQPLSLFALNVTWDAEWQNNDSFFFSFFFWGRAISQNWMSRMCADWTICALVTQFSPSLSIQFWHPSKNVFRQIDWMSHRQTLKGKIQIWTHTRLLHRSVFILNPPFPGSLQWWGSKRCYYGHVRMSGIFLMAV